MKNKKGFTLIELLAVIVVLAIIALIATPIVMNTIKNAKKGAAERTADNYIKQVETAIAEAKLENKSVPDGTYDIDKDGNLTGAGLPDGKLEVDMSGNKPTSGKITIKNNGVGKDKSNVKIGDYIVSYDKDNNKQQAYELYKGVLCKAVTTATTGNIPQGKFAYGDEYTCELGDNDTKTFFILETNGDNVSLIMNANVGKDGKAITSSSTDKGTVAWISKEDYLTAGGIEDAYNDYRNNHLGPITAEKTLKTNTKGWIKINQNQISLPTGQQIRSLASKDADDDVAFSYYTSLPTWLISNIDLNNYTYGYWLSTVSKNMANNRPQCVNNDGNPYVDVNATEYYGVRPVITVSKSNLS